MAATWTLSNLVRCGVAVACGGGTEITHAQWCTSGVGGRGSHIPCLQTSRHRLRGPPTTSPLWHARPATLPAHFPLTIAVLQHPPHPKSVAPSPSAPVVQQRLSVFPFSPAGGRERSKVSCGTRVIVSQGALEPKSLPAPCCPGADSAIHGSKPHAADHSTGMILVLQQNDAVSHSVPAETKPLSRRE